MSDVKVSVRNITRIYRQATADDRVEGRGWYATAREVAESLDPADPVRAAAVLAVLSPQLSWKRNVTEARNAYAGRPIKTLGRNADKARRIIAGEDPEDVVSGPKVRASSRASTAPPSPLPLCRQPLGSTGDATTLSLTTAEKGLAGMTKKHFEAVARILAEAGEVPPDQARDHIARNLARVFAESNPRFNLRRFLSAAGIPD